MLHSPDVIETLRRDLLVALSEHEREVLAAANIKAAAIERCCSGAEAVTRLYELSTDEEARPKLRALCTGQTPRTQDDIAFAHNVVQQVFGAVLAEWREAATRHLREATAVAVAHAREVLLPALQSRFERELCEQHLAMARHMTQRGAFLEHEFHLRAASIANREGRFFSPHIADLLRQVAVSHQRALDAERHAAVAAPGSAPSAAATAPSTLPPNPLAENQTAAAQLERAVLNALRPDTLEKMEPAEVRAKLAEALERERHLWALVDTQQRTIVAAAEHEEARRAQFESELRARLSGRVEALESEVDALTSELNQSRLAVRDLERERDDAHVIAFRLDALCATLNLELTVLHRVAGEQGIVTGELARIEQQLRRCEKTSCATEPLAVGGGWGVDEEAPATRELLRSLRSRPLSAPEPPVLEVQRALLRSVLEHVDVRKDAARLKEELEQLRGALAEVTRAKAAAASAHHSELRRVVAKGEAAVQHLLCEREALRAQLVRAQARAAAREEACGGESRWGVPAGPSGGAAAVVDDLSRALRASTRRVRELEVNEALAARRGKAEQGSVPDSARSPNMATGKPPVPHAPAPPCCPSATQRPQTARVPRDVRHHLEPDIAGGAQGRRAMLAQLKAATAVVRRAGCRGGGSVSLAQRRPQTARSRAVGASAVAGEKCAAPSTPPRPPT